MNKIVNKVIIDVEAKKAEAAVGDLKKDLKDTGKEGKKAGKDTSKELDKAGKSAKKGSKGLNIFRKGLKAIGGELKALGIGLLIAAVAALGNALSKNQKVMDAFNITLDTISGVVNQVVTALTDTYDSLMENKEGFESFKKVILGIINIALTPLMLQFYNIKGAILVARLAWEKSIFGSGDTETIDNLTESLAENTLKIAQVAAQAVQSGKDIKDNIGDAISFVGEAGEKAVENLGKVSVKTAYEGAKAATELNKTALLSEAALQGSIERYDRLAEQQRQIRDNENATYADRIKASEALGEILDKQEKQEIKLAEVKLAAARQELQNNKDNIEMQRAVMDAENEVAAVQARIEGQRSEYLTSNNSLLRERKEALQQVTDAALSGFEKEREEFRKTYEEEKELINKTVADEEEKNRLLVEAKERYNQKVVELEAERVRAINEVLDFEGGGSELDKALAEEEKLKEERLRELEELEASEEAKAQVIEHYDNKVRELKEENAKKEAENRKKLLEAEITMSIGAASAIADALDAGADVQKSIALAQALWNTYQGITQALNAPTLVQRIAGVAFASATGFAAVKDIMKTTKDNAASMSGGGGGNRTVTQANFNTVGDTRANAEIERDAEDTEPVKAYVVGNDVTTQQEADRNKVDNSTFLG